MVIAGFARFLVTYPRLVEQSYNSAVYAERAVSAVRNYDEHMDGRSLGKRRGIYFKRTLHGVTLGLRKLDRTTPMVTVPLLAGDMRAIRKVMDVNNIRDVTYWALWASKWQGIMRGSDVLRPTKDKTRKLDPTKDTHVGRVTLEEVDPEQNRGCKTRMRWHLEPRKTDHSWKKASIIHF